MNFYKKNKHTIRLLIFMIFLLGKTSSAIFAQTTLEGKVTDEETGEEMIGASIVIKRDGYFIQGISTDIGGNFSTKVEPGTYDIEVSYTGYRTQKVVGVVTSEGQATKVDVKLGIGDAQLLEDLLVRAITIPLIKQDDFETGKKITESINLENLPTRNIQDMILISAGTTFQ